MNNNLHIPRFIVLCALLLLALKYCSDSKADAPYHTGDLPIDKALDAGYNQCGLEKTQNQIQSYLVDTYVKPYYLDRLVSPYFIYRKRELSFPIHGNRVTLHTNGASLSVPF